MDDAPVPLQSGTTLLVAQFLNSFNNLVSESTSLLELVGRRTRPCAAGQGAIRRTPGGIH